MNDITDPLILSIGLLALICVFWSGSIMESLILSGILITAAVTIPISPSIGGILYIEPPAQTFKEMQCYRDRTALDIIENTSKTSR
ncbi:hypothetical protein [Pseudoalteromonas marina]|uniref:Uncharacterized protein n=1 Tax=Pseudoalteromonas marina TaxID=267375 RepID=A0ABT9FC87_9GAMM|nr:hypothetical protein [Pseudoalteromonas marina]MDP2564406.1 hypothetical protein [Pseudoalteromonas marina]